MLIEASSENARKLLDAFQEAHLGTALLTTPEEVIAQEITIFRDRVRIDVQTSTPGTEFQDVWQHRETLSFQGVTIEIVGLEDLISTKRAAGRQVDLADVAVLEQKRRSDIQ